MSSKGSFNLPLYIEYKPPRILFFFIHLSHGCALFSLFITSLGQGIILMLIIFISGSWAWHTGKFKLESSRHPEIKLIMKSNGEWLLLGKNKKPGTVLLMPGIFVHPRLVILCLRDENHERYNFFLTRENVDEVTLRRLAVRLRFPG